VFEERIEKIIFVPIQNQNNCYQPEELQFIFKEKNFITTKGKNLKDALNSISLNKPLFITGSLYLMVEVLKLFSVKKLNF
jgi:folylpolyglutamate synthase/dihydropteroate synthase